MELIYRLAVKQTYIQIWLQAFSNTVQELEEKEKKQLRNYLNVEEKIMLDAILSESYTGDLLATTLGLGAFGGLAAMGLAATAVCPPLGLLAVGVGFCVGISRLGR